MNREHTLLRIALGAYLAFAAIAAIHSLLQATAAPAPCDHQRAGFGCVNGLLMAP